MSSCTWTKIGLVLYVFTLAQLYMFISISGYLGYLVTLCSSCCAAVWQLSVLMPPPVRGPAARLVLIYGIGMEPLPAHLFPCDHC